MPPWPSPSPLAPTVATPLRWPSRPSDRPDPVPSTASRVVELVDHPGGAHDPRIGVALGVTATLGAEQRGLLLRPPDEQHPLVAGEPGQVLVHDVVLALALHEVDPRHPLIAGEAAHRVAERVSDLPERGGRGDRQPELALDVAQQSAGVLQL